MKEMVQAGSDTAAAGKRRQSSCLRKSGQKQLRASSKRRLQAGLVQQELRRPDGTGGFCSTARCPERPDPLLSRAPQPEGCQLQEDTDGFRPPARLPPPRFPQRALHLRNQEAAAAAAADVILIFMKLQKKEKLW